MRARRGQTAVEYVLAVLALLAAAYALSYVGAAASRAARRNSEIMATDCP